MGEAIICRRGNGSDFSDATATSSDILTGKTAGIGDVDEVTTGTMKNNGSVTITPTTTNQTIAQGYHSGSGIVKGDSDLVSANIMSGKEIFGVNGTFTSDGTVGASQVLSGYTIYANGKVTGSMKNNGSVTITPSTTNQTIANGYHNGSGIVKGDSNLVSANIKSGSSIFGVSGKSSVIDTSGVTATAPHILSGYSGYREGVKVNGSMTNRSTTSVNVIASSNTNGDIGVDFTIPQGYYDGNTKLAISDNKLVSSNIKNGTTIFGVTGNASVGGQSYIVSQYTNPSQSYTVNLNPIHMAYTNAGFVPRFVSFRGYQEANISNQDGSIELRKRNPFQYIIILFGDYYYYYTPKDMANKSYDYTLYSADSYLALDDTVGQVSRSSFLNNTFYFTLGSSTSMGAGNYQTFNHVRHYYEIEAFGQ